MWLEESKIDELYAERIQDRLDERLGNQVLTQKRYDYLCKELEKRTE